MVAAWAEAGVDCTRADGDVNDEQRTSAPNDLGEELGLCQDPSFG